MSSLPKLRIAICGGGIAGLTLACALSRSPDIHIDIYEAASQFAEVGAGIGLWWRPKRVLSAMGLEQDLKALGAKFGDERVTSMTYRKSDQPEGQHVATITSRGTLTTLHRAEFHSTLLRRLSPRVNVHTSKRLVTYTQQPNAHDPIQLRFSDGSVATCDVLVGADGIKSVVRAGVMHEHAVAAEAANRHSEAAAVRECVQPRFGGSVVYRVMIPSEKLARIAPRHRVLRSPHQYIGRNRHLIAYPVSNGHLVNVALFSAKQAQEGSAYPEPWVSQADPCEVLRQFEGWEPEVRQLIQSMDGLAINKWVVNVTQPLPSYCWGRAVLLGDAAHAMTPFQGAGAGSAIEDAFMLANLLASRHATRATMPRVLRLFSQARQPANNRIAALSRSNGLLFSMNSPQVGLSEFARLVQRNWDEGQGGDPLADVRHAVEALESS